MTELKDGMVFVCKVNDKSVKCTDGNIVLNMGSAKGLDYARISKDNVTYLKGKAKAKDFRPPIETMTAQQIIDMV